MRRTVLLAVLLAPLTAFAHPIHATIEGNLLKVRAFGANSCVTSPAADALSEIARRPIGIPGDALLTTGPAHHAPAALPRGEVKLPSIDVAAVLPNGEGGKPEAPVTRSVNEPGALALFIAGVLALLMRRRRATQSIGG